MFTINKLGVLRGNAERARVRSRPKGSVGSKSFRSKLLS